MSLRPDLTATWLYRGQGPELEILLLHRAPGRILAGMWQCVTGGLEADERIIDGALREVSEETGFTRADLEALYDLDMINSFTEPSYDAVLLEANFAARVCAGREPTLSPEHDGLRWCSLEEARRLLVWPAYREAVGRIVTELADPDRAPWFQLSLDGRGQRIVP
ncbi:MAG TPA: NUDIX domain-containing protein [Candidatus Limnocylindrales bacterium]|nr:NUDIX domain-containing protein [Candidatus Limnocylindrales bacterium]